MKFDLDDHVRVIAWVPPGVTAPTADHIVCGMTGIVTKIRVNQPDQNSDGEYRVAFNNGHRWWFRACDLVAEDSECTCDDVVKRIPTMECLVHDQPDPDPVSSAVAKLQALASGLDKDADD